MKKISLFSLVLYLSLLFYSCDKNNPFNGTAVPEGAYAYTGYDSTGVKIVQGWIKFEFEDKTTLSGEWELDKVGISVPRLDQGNLSAIFKTANCFSI